jgi:predicted alpha-1,2-mannosidase
MLTRRNMLKGAAAGGLWIAGGGPGDLFAQVGGHGHTFPGATVPSGMVQLSPDSGKQGWDWCAGYNYADTSIAGFSHTHLSGTGIGDLCDILVTPTLAGDTMPDDVSSPFTHDRERASPGYYSVDLLAHDIRAELTATRRVGLHRYNFLRRGGGRQAALLFDLGFAINWDQATDTQLVIEGPTTISGYRFSDGWAKNQKVYFVARLSVPIQTWLFGADGEYSAERREIRAKKAKGLCRFVLRPGEPLLVKVGISAVSVDGARRNLEREAPGWEFDTVRRDAEEAWERKLRRLRIQTPDVPRKKIFYTALYHALLAPTTFCDVDLSYRGADGSVQASTGFQNHTVFSLWDTFRALHPLLTLIQPERVDDLAQSMMAFGREHGQLPVWSLWGHETGTMIGYHSAPVLVDAKGLTTVNRGEALELLKRGALQDAGGLSWLSSATPLGYLPADKEVESVSKTLEYAYDDWCIARLAAKLERLSDRRLFEARAANYRNLFDPSTGFMRPRLANGSWKAPFSPSQVERERHDYTEGNAWQYSWSVMHDVRGLMTLMGGPAAFVKRLDELFDQPAVADPNAPPDVSGLIGQYAHGNEPSHHVAYLYAYASAPWMAASRVNRIVDTLYGAGPDGLCGNEDCGQMSAWYLFSAIGLYPVNPAEGVYVFGAPSVERASIDLGAGRTFVIEAEGLSPERRFVTGATLNGKPVEQCWISHADVAAGGTLRFTMGAEPNRAWASSPAAAPPSMTA